MAGLTATAGTGSQTTTQSPQGLAGSSSLTSQSSNIQPGTEAALLLSRTGITLSTQQLTAVNLNTSASSSAQSQVTKPPAHHNNAMLLGLAVILLVIAAVSVLVLPQQAKNTT